MGGRSVIDGGRFTKGVCQVIVNFPPDTEITQLINTYFLNQVPVQRLIDFNDAVPDTVPYGSWVKLLYTGSDSPYDSIMCQDLVNQCIKYQVAYHSYSARFPYVDERSAYLPHDGEDNNPFGLTDSTSMNFGSVEYEVFVRSLDEHGKPDDTPAQVDLIGNFDPTLDECYLSDHFDNRALNGDTITWDWWHPANADTFNEQTLMFEKTFKFVVNASGHDHPWETASGVKNWFYSFFDPQGTFVRLMRAGSWVPGSTLNILSDTLSITFTYELTDPMGDAVFANLPGYVNEIYDFVLQGRDTATDQFFSQYMFVNGVQEKINEYPVSILGRWTEERSFQFHFRMIR
jgi:hypothetical protein